MVSAGFNWFHRAAFFVMCATLCSMDMVTADETLPAPIGHVASEIAIRIATERDRLAAEEATERELIARRKAMLADGGDAQLDEIENGIGTSRSKQLRAIERIHILGEHLVSANVEAENEKLNAIEARLDRAETRYKALIMGEYLPHATALAKVLHGLAVIDELFNQDNDKLRAGGRAAVPSPNRMRCRPSQKIERTERRRVGINERDHPLYGKVDERSSGTGPSLYYEKGTGKRVETFGEFDIVRSITIPADMPFPLWKEVVMLPSACAAPDPMPGETVARAAPPIWRGSDHFPPVTAEDAAALRTELDLEASAGNAEPTSGSNGNERSADQNGHQPEAARQSRKANR
jgi:hypothetical protein